MRFAHPVDSRQIYSPDEPFSPGEVRIDSYLANAVDSQHVDSPGEVRIDSCLANPVDSRQVYSPDEPFSPGEVRIDLCLTNAASVTSPGDVTLLEGEVGEWSDRGGAVGVGLRSPHRVGVNDQLRSRWHAVG